MKTSHESVGTPDDRLDLLAGSPCVDAGGNKQVPPDVADLDGDRDTLERMPLDIPSRPRFIDIPASTNAGVADPPGYPPPPSWISAPTSGVNNGILPRRRQRSCGHYVTRRFF